MPKATRVDLSKRTKLTKMTVTNIFNELAAMGYVSEMESDSSVKYGRNPMIVDIAATAPKIIGVYISRDNIVGVLSDLKLNIHERFTLALRNETASTLMDKLIKCVTVLYPQNDRVVGIGVSSIGPINAKAGVILNPLDFFGISNFPIKKIIEREFNCPVYTENDMNSSALAEMYYGSHKNLVDFLYVGITNGIGAGVICDNHLLKNQAGFASEIGHMVLDINGELCNCGNRGCLEAYMSMPKLMTRLRAETGKDMSFEEFCALDDERCRFVFNDVCRMLAVALTNTVNMLNSQIIFLGHMGASLSADCIWNIEEYINTHRASKDYGKVHVYPSSFGDESPVFGSVCLVASKIFSGELI